MKKPKKLEIVYESMAPVMDKYTILLKDGSVFTMSDNAMSPMGFNQYAGTYRYRKTAMDNKVEWKDLPEQVKQAIIDRCKWGYRMKRRSVKSRMSLRTTGRPRRRMRAKPRRR